MPVSATITRSVQIGPTTPVTNALLRLLGLPSISLTGSVGSGDIAAGAITPALSSPGAYWFGTTTGAANTYALALNPALGALADGVWVAFKINVTCTNPSTLNVNGLGAVNLKRNGEDLKQGDLLAGRVYVAMYSSTGPSWDVLTRLGNPDFRYETAGGTGNAITYTSSGTNAVNSLSALRGQVIAFRVTGTNTGAVTLAVDGLAATAVVYPGNVALAGGELVAGDIALVTYSSVLAKFILVSPSPKVGPFPVPVAAARNLEFRSTSTTAATLTADEVVLKSTAGTGVARLFSTVSTSVDITLGVALNAFETGGSRTTSRWYYVWLISDGTNLRTVLEDSGSADGAVPAGPDLSGGAFSGYNWQALIGQIRLNATGSGEIVPFHQRDRQVWFKDTNVFTALAPSTSYVVLAAGNLTNLRAAVPPTALACGGTLGADNATDAAQIVVCGTNNDGTVDSTPNEIGGFTLNATNVSAYNSFGHAVPFQNLPVRGAASRNVQLKASGAGIDCRMNLSSYTF